MEADLALLRVADVADMPRPIDPFAGPAPTETMAVRICGFPFGDALAVGKGNPAVTIGRGSVSSLRLGEDGELAVIQIDGSINPGNSGGPILDTDGQLVGIAVATIKGSGIGLAIPAGDLRNLLQGRAHPPRFLPVGLDERTARFLAAVPLSDPLKRVRSVTLYVSKGDAAVPAAGPWKVLPGARRLAAERAGSAAVATLELPAGPGTVLVQVACTSEDGEEVVSRPMPYRLNVRVEQTAADAMPLSAVSQDPKRYEGKTVVVRGQLFPVGVIRGNLYELQASDERGVKPNLSLYTTKAVMRQLSEVPRIEQNLPVRMTMRVGKADNGGRHAVRVTRVDFLGRGGRVVKSLPNDDDAKDPFLALNRYPERFVGQAVMFHGMVTSNVVLRGQERELFIALLSGQRPDGVHFTSSARLGDQLAALRLPGEGVYARVTAFVEDKSNGYRRHVSVRKVEFLDDAGRVVRTLE